MSIKRYYGDNGELIRYEMRTRAKRYKREAMIETIKPYALIVVSMTLLTVWYLINN